MHIHSDCIFTTTRIVPLDDGSGGKLHRAQDARAKLIANNARRGFRMYVRTQ
jgi:hypothetical protein